MPSNRYAPLPLSLLLAALVFLPQTALAQRLADASGSAAAGPYVEIARGPHALRGSEGELVLSHSASFDIVDETGIACSAGGLTSANSYYRVFDLQAFGLTEPLAVVSVDIGIESVNINDEAPVSNVRIHRLEGEFVTENLDLVQGVEFDLLDGFDLSVVNVPIEGTFTTDDVLVVEWSVPDLRAEGGGVFFGANSAGQTGPTYVRAAECGLTQPTDLASIGFPDAHWVLQVNGTTIPTSNEGTAVAQRVTLGQAYPNPAVGRAAIPFALDSPQRVHIAVYDALGREVAVAADRTFGAGQRSVAVDVAGLPSGLYFVRLRAGDQTLTRKLVVTQ